MQVKTNSLNALEEVQWLKQLARLEGAYAESTLRAYRTDISSFVRWCAEKEITPFPAQPEVVSAFIYHEAARCCPSTIKRRLAALGKLHRLMRLENPIGDEEVRLAVRRALRAKYSRPSQALGLTAQLLDRLISTCDETLTGRRDRALIAVGYDTLARRSELVALSIEDLNFSDKSTRLLIRRAKNDPFGKGRISHLRPATKDYLKDWIGSSHIREGAIFRAIKHDRISNRKLHTYSINRILKKLALKAGVSPKDIEKLSGHTMRVGAAQDMMMRGLDILPIMAAGGWKTTHVVARYIENADLSSFLKYE